MDCLHLGHCMYLSYFMANTCYRGAEGVFIQIKRRQRKNFKKVHRKSLPFCKNLLRRKTIFGNIFLWQKVIQSLQNLSNKTFLSLENIQVCQYGSNLSPYWNTDEPLVFSSNFSIQSLFCILMLLGPKRMLENNFCLISNVFWIQNYIIMTFEKFTYFESSIRHHSGNYCSQNQVIQAWQSCHWWLYWSHGTCRLWRGHPSPRCQSSWTWLLSSCFQTHLVLLKILF